MSRKGVSSILGGLLLFMLISTSLVIFLSETNHEKDKVEKDLKSLYYSLNHNILEGMPFVKQSSQGGIIDFIDYNDIIRVLIVYPNKTITVKPVSEVVEDKGKGIIIKKNILEQISDDTLILILDLGLKGSLKVRSNNLSDGGFDSLTVNVINKTASTAALLSLIQDIIGPKEAYNLFFIENNGLESVDVVKITLPLSIKIKVKNIRLVIEKTNEGCPAGKFRIKQWRVETDYSMLFWINNRLVKNDTGHLSFATRLTSGPFTPMYYNYTNIIPLDITTSLPLRFKAYVYTSLKFSASPPSPFYCTNQWRVHSPSLSINSFVEMEISYSGDKTPLLVTEANHLSLWSGNSSIMFLGNYYLENDMVLSYNSTRVLEYRDYIKNTTYYEGGVKAENPTINFIFAELS